MSSSGLMIHTQFPCMGATPDGVVNCECCGKGVLEIKCPYSCVTKSFLEAAKDRQFFVESNNGKSSLKRNHAYYYQIQMQLKLSESS